VKSSIQKLRDTQKTLTQSLHNNEVTEDSVRVTPTAGSEFPQVQAQKCDTVFKQCHLDFTT